MRAPLAVLVTGSREWTDGEAIALALGKLNRPLTVLIHGDCGSRSPHGGRVLRGADLFAADRAKFWGWTVLSMPAQWNRYGTRAGSIRNNDMLTVLGALRAVGYDAIVIGFPLPQSKGTVHCMRLAKKYGFEVINAGASG